MIAILILSLAYRASQQHLPVLLLGAFFIVIGSFFGIAGTWALGSNLTPFPKPIDKARLVRNGVYALVRHPLYTSVTFLSAGWALAWQSVSGLAAVLGLALFFVVKARIEERWLREKFPDYEDYSRQTHKFIPWVY